MKSLFYCLFLSLLLPFAVSCHKDNNAKPENNNPPAEDSTKGDSEFGTFTFTCRGEQVTCTPSQNGAGFQDDGHGNLILHITGTDLKAASHAEQAISIETLVGGKLHTGTYKIVTPKAYSDCIAGETSFAEIGIGIIIPNAKQTEEIFWTKALNSTSGTLKITKIELGKFSSIGTAEGHISGSFSFSGNTVSGQNPGTATGKFENIPLLVVQ